MQLQCRACFVSLYIYSECVHMHNAFYFSTFHAQLQLQLQDRDLHSQLQDPGAVGAIVCTGLNVAAVIVACGVTDTQLGALEQRSTRPCVPCLCA